MFLVMNCCGGCWSNAIFAQAMKVSVRFFCYPAIVFIKLGNHPALENPLLGTVRCFGSHCSADGHGELLISYLKVIKLLTYSPTAA